MLEQVPELDAIVTPLGGGGLLSGTLIVAKTLRPGVAVYGAEPQLANDWQQSLERGERVEIPPPKTIADGLRTPTPGKITFPIVKDLAKGVLAVSEAEIRETVRFLLTRTKLLVEPSGAVAAAAILFRKLPKPVQSVGVLLTGGNVDLDVLAEICGEAA
jgi:threonine dehydratase